MSNAVLGIAAHDTFSPSEMDELLARVHKIGKSVLTAHAVRVGDHVMPADDGAPGSRRG